MGYKLSGYEVIGGVDIDPKMMAIYRANHNPRHSYLMGVGDFNKIDSSKIPDELFQLDILDGSPPCSSFSTAGAREKKWGKSSKFREGQAEQVLDDLFFQFIETANKLRPKVVIAENVKGLIIGNAKGYVKDIFRGFDKIGYDCQLFLLNGSRMSVPQIRERTFFIARRRDLGLPNIKLHFDDEPINADQCVPLDQSFGPVINEGKTLEYWKKCPPGYGFNVVGGYGAHKKLAPNKVANTQTATLRHYHWAKPVRISDLFVIRIQTFPDDYNFLNNEVHYVCGMSVPPFMMQRISEQIRLQWFK